MREWFHLPGFPVFRGVVFWQDFVEWRTCQNGFKNPSLLQRAGDTAAAASSLPPRAAQILIEAWFIKSGGKELASVGRRVLNDPMPEASYSGFVRHFYRSYRNGRIRIGHSLIRRALQRMVAKHQEIELRSGLKMDLDLTMSVQNGVFWSDGDLEIPLIWAIRELLPIGGVCVDCGANCGLMGLLAWQYRQARVILIEPHPQLAKSAGANIRLNCCGESCELIEAAASDSSGEVTFYENTASDGGHSIHNDLAVDSGEMRPLGKVRCVTLKEIVEVKKLPKIHFLKIDTEGNDYAVLKGLACYLQPSFTEAIYVEMARDREVIRDLMQSKGYVGFTQVPRRNRAHAKAQQLFERGESVNFFAPLVGNTPAGGELLWCGENSCLTAYLMKLNR